MMTNPQGDKLKGWPRNYYSNLGLQQPKLTFFFTEFVWMFIKYNHETQNVYLTLFCKLKNTQKAFLFS